MARSAYTVRRPCFPNLYQVCQNPVQLTHAGDGSGRLFVLEKEGRVRIVRDGVLVETPFLDISQRVTAEGTGAGASECRVSAFISWTINDST